MSAIALVLRAMGHRVSGSDLKDSPVAERLRSHGITVAVGHRPENVAGAEVVTFSPAVQAENPELRGARDRGVRVVPRSEMLAAVCATRRCLAVAGTHGKTTTASMLSLILVEAGLRPSFVIGADVNEIGTNAVWDTGEWLVVEADESYGTFQAIRPDLAVLTNVEPDHLDYYGTFAALRERLLRLLGRRDAGLHRVLGRSRGGGHRRELRGRSPWAGAESTYSMGDIELQRSSASFRLRGPDGDLGILHIGVPGLHNARNAAVAAVAALQVGATFAAAQAALARFAGVTRRFEFRGESAGVTFVDDYAHLPTEVRAALATARSGGWSRVVAVFQPHRFSRTAALASAFGTAFSDADVLVVTDVYSAGERAVPGVSGRLVADAVREQDPRLPVTYAAGWEELRLAVGRSSGRATSCLTLGAGTSPRCPTTCSSPRSGDAERGAARPGGAARSPGDAHEAARATDHLRRRRPRRGLRRDRGARRPGGRPGALRARSERGDSAFVLGRGSNLLVADAGFDGIVLRLGSGFSVLELPAGDGEARLRLPSCGPARRWPCPCWPAVWPKQAGRGCHGRSGYPGSVGGAVRMNAGGHGSDMASCLVRYTWVTSSPTTGGTDDVGRLAYGYRSSSVTASSSSWGRSFEVTPGSVEAEQDAAGRHRAMAAGAPAGWLQRGSVFTNPRGRFGREADRSGRVEGVPDRDGPRVGEARQLHSGGQGGPGRRRARADGACARGGRRAMRGRAAHRGPSPRLRRRKTGAGPDRRTAATCAAQAVARSRRGTPTRRTDRQAGAGGRGARAAAAGWIRASRPAVRRHQGARTAPAAGAGHRRGGVGAWSAAGSCPFAAVLRPIGHRDRQRARDRARRWWRRRGWPASPPLLDVNTGAWRPGIEQLPWVRSATVHVSWPDGVHIAVTEETPALVVAAPPGGRWASLSADGRVLATSPARPTGLARPRGPGALGRARARVLGRGAAGLRVAATLPPAFAAQVTSVRGRARGQGELALTTPDHRGHRTASRAQSEVRGRRVDSGGATLTAGDVIDVSVPDSPTVTTG